MMGNSESQAGLAARIEQLVADQRDLLNAIAHELRTPLARARFALDMGADEDGWQSSLRADLDEMSGLLDAMLGYGRLDTQEAVCPEDIALAGWLPAVLNQQGGTAIASHVPALTVRADPRLLRQALGNLLGNARRHACGQVWFSVAARGEEVWLVVDDDGLGVPAADRERIFNPFVRLDGSRCRASGGAGLGLALVRRIAQKHQGRAWVEDRPGGSGARFVFAWPGLSRR